MAVMPQPHSNKRKHLPRECHDCAGMKVLNKQRRSSLTKSMAKQKHKLESGNKHIPNSDICLHDIIDMDMKFDS